MASVAIIPRSPHWIARMRIWVVAPEHRDGGFWRLTMRSTGLRHDKVSRKVAKRTADEMERIGRELKTQPPDSAWAARRMESLLRGAGLEGMVRRSTWEKAAAGFVGAKTAKPASIDAYNNHIAHFTGWLGQRARHDLRSIGPDDISEFYQNLLNRGFSERHATHVTKTVRSVFARALHLREIEANPASLFRMSETISHDGRKPFTQQEISAILDKADDEWKIACQFGLFYGMRLGDAIRRDYSEIRDGILHFVPQKKSRRGKVVSVPLVGELSALCGKGKITPTLAKLTTNAASRRFFKILEAAGVKQITTTSKGEGRGITDKTFHSWRHTVNSMLVDAGVDQRVRQLICDHDSTRVSNNYTHASIETMAKALEPLAGLTTPSSRSPRGCQRGQSSDTVPARP